MADPRSDLIATALAMGANGLNRGTTGNVSVRAGDGFHITPTGMPYASLVADDIPLMAAWREAQGTVGDTTAVFRDNAFQNDVAKSNLAAILEQHGIKQVRSL